MYIAKCKKPRGSEVVSSLVMRTGIAIDLLPAGNVHFGDEGVFVPFNALVMHVLAARLIRKV